MDEQDQIKAKQYDSLMSQYVHYENELKFFEYLGKYC